MASTHGSDSASSLQSSLPSSSHSHQYPDFKTKMFKFSESDSELESVATNASKMNHGSRRKQNFKLSQSNRSYRNDDAKKLADQRWRQSINDCYNVLRDYTEKDLVFHDGTILKGKECKSRNDLLAKTIDLIGELESLFSELCLRQPDSLNYKESLNSIREKFVQDKKQIKPKNLSLQQ